MANAAELSPTDTASRRRWTRRGLLINWCAASVGATLLTACGPQVVPAAGTSLPAPAPAATSVAASTSVPQAQGKPIAAPTLVPAGAPTAAPKPASPTPRDGGSFRFYIWTEDPPTLDPYLNVSFRCQEFAAFFYSRLLMSKKGPGISAQAYILEGDLAESWKASADGMTYTFNLRPDAKWHNLPPMNGRPVTAQDVVWSFERFMKVSAQKSTFDQVADVTAPDARTVQFRLKDVYVPFEASIGAPLLWIMPREVIEADGDASKRIVGSGPFIFNKFDPGISFSGKKNPNYYRKGEPHVDEIVGLIIPDTSTQLAALRSRQLDFYQLLSHRAAQEVQPGDPIRRVGVVVYPLRLLEARPASLQRPACPSGGVHGAEPR